MRQPSRNSIRPSRHSPIDLWKLKASARMPGGDFGISCISQPHANWPMNSAAISQCSATAVRV